MPNRTGASSIEPEPPRWKGGGNTMAEQIGLVTKTFENDMAEVVIDRKNACGGCGQAQGCRTCLAGGKMVARVRNPVGAGRGDVVSIYLKDSTLWTGAVFLYIIPVLWLAAGAFIGAGVGADWTMGQTGTEILFGLSGLALGLLMTMGIAKSSRFRQEIIPRIVRILHHAA